MKCIVSLTTIPNRLNKQRYGERGIQSCLKSLIEQSHDDYEIHFNVPDVNFNTGEEYIIPEWCNEFPDHFKIYRTEDYGSITKLVPTLQRVTDPEAIIIVCDDDLVYHEDMVKEQINNQTNKYDFDAAVGYDGMQVRTPIFGNIRDHYFSGAKVDSEVKVLQGYKTVSYRRRFFDDSFFNDFVGKSWEDDLVISAYIASKNIKKMVTFHPDTRDFETVDDWHAYGGVTTFPVIKHTDHDSVEGCNYIRSGELPQEKRSSDWDGQYLWKFLDRFSTE